MHDGLVALLTEIRQAPFDWSEIAKRMGAENCYEVEFPGKAAKYGLRIIVENFIKKASKWAHALELPETDYSYCEDRDSRIIVHGKSSQNNVTIFDSAVLINDLPVVIDVRMTDWKKARHEYFDMQGLSRDVVLEDMFGKRGCDRVLVVPDSPDTIRYGVHIARPSFALQPYHLQAGAMARKYNLIKAKSQESNSA